MQGILNPMNGNRIKIARIGAGFSQSALSAATQGRLSVYTVRKLERGDRIPSSNELLALIDTLNIPLHFLFDRDGTSIAEANFRNKSSMRKRDRCQIEVKVLEWIDRYLQIESILDIDCST